VNPEPLAGPGQSLAEFVPEGNGALLRDMRGAALGLPSSPEARKARCSACYTFIMTTRSADRRQPRTAFEERYLAEARRICLDMVPEGYEVFLFGSRARGHCEHCEHSSDLDIGIVGPGPLPGGVSRLTDRLLDSDVPWRPQVVDFSLVTDEVFRRKAYEDRELGRPANEAATISAARST